MLMSVTNALLIALQTGVLVFLFPLYLANRAGMTPQAIGLIVSLSALGRLCALWFGGTLSDRRGRLRLLVPGLGCYALLFGILPLLTHPALLGLWSLASGAALGFVAPIPTALVGDQAPPRLQGVAVGWLRMLTDTGHLLGPLVMGPLADAFGLAAPFFLGAALLIAAMWRCGRVPVITTPGVTT
jgi:MFS family permease